jgi:ABC-type nitrate/sulfonate/bicarbonate transport system ATPase subunit
MKDEISSLPCGAYFWRADLHIHSFGGSHDVRDKTCTPERIVAEAKKERLNIIAIADHNEITNVAAADAAAKKVGDLVVIPAVELSTPQGHLLCYLPSLDALRRFYSKLTIGDRNTPNSNCMQGMVECLDHLNKEGGFGVLAHVDGGNGFDTVLKTSTPHKLNVLYHPALLGLELTSIACPVHYSELDSDSARKAAGRTRNQKLGYGPQQCLARILNSDSHTLKAVGRNAANDSKVTRFKMGEPTFEGLRIAMVECDSRVRIEEGLEANVPQIVGLKFSGGFLGGQTVHFSPNLNCIIGGRGTGKSTMFEAIRCLSGYAGEKSKVVDSDVWPDHVYLLVQDEAGATHAVTRTKDGERENPDELFAEPVTFPVECYRQGETHDISQQAHDPLALLAYLDRFTGVAEDIEREAELIAEIDKLQKEAEKARGVIDTIPKAEADLKYVQGQIKAINDAKGKEVIDLQRTVEREKTIRASIVAKANTISTAASRQELKDGITAIRSAADPMSLKDGNAEFTAIGGLLTQFEQDLSASDTALQKSATTLTAGIKAQILVWQTKAQTTNAAVDTKRKELEAKGIQVNMQFFEKLVKDESRLSEALKTKKLWPPHLKTVEVNLAKAIKDRWSVRDRIATKRTAYAVVANKALKALADLTVTLKFASNAYSPEANDIIATAAGWRTSQLARASNITENITVPKLLAAITKKDNTALLALVDETGKKLFTPADATNLLARLGDPVNRSKLEKCAVADKPSLTVSRTRAGQDGKTLTVTRQFNQLSLGQQQSVLLALMLSSSSNLPLIVDQPEDNLDGQFIYSSIVPVLRQAKERRQIIVVTHNPNIAVLGDAEQIIVLRAAADRSVIAARGSIDDTVTRDAACNILEGHQEAFKRRARIYGFRFKD